METATPTINSARVSWFRSARFGMFVHWGPYSVGGRGEWLMNRERIPVEEYDRLYSAHFKAERFNPAEWCKLAQDAGMKYIVLTTRHHDGYCLWDSKTTNRTATKLGPMRDLVREYVDAVRGTDLKLGFYFSVGDWAHPDYPGAFERDWPTQWKSEQSRLRFVAYYTEQLRELMTNYGKVDLLWYDGCIPTPTDGEAANAMVRQLQPDILISNRNGGEHDFHCCEQTINPPKQDIPWEACMTLNANWGYHSGDMDFKRPVAVAKMLVSCAKDCGNLLLNVAPMPDGTLPPQNRAILEPVGRWLETVRPSLEKTVRSPFSWNNLGSVTCQNDRMHLFIYSPVGKTCCFADLKNEPRSVRLLNENRVLPFERRDGRTWIHELPLQLPEGMPLVVEIVTGEKPEPHSEIKTFWIPQ